MDHHHNHPQHHQHHHHNHHPQQHSHHQQHHHHNQQPPHQQHSMYPTTNNNSSPYQTPQMISTPNFSSNKFPFTTTTTTTPISHQQQQPTSAAPSSKPPPGDSMGPPYSGSGSAGFDPNGQKKKRGRPRKYSPDSGGGGVSGSGGGGGVGGGIALGLSPTPISSVVVSPSGADSTGATPENASKKNRGRPAGSSKKQLDALGNCGVGFTPHVILVNAGEDIASKIRAFSQQGARTVCVLSANGSISDVDLRQPAMVGGIVKYEGRFEIISLSGSFLFSENSGGQSRPGGLSVSLAGSDGRVLGGGVVGVLRAATPVQIIVGSFIADGKKPKYMPSVPQSHMLSFAAPPLPAADSSPPSQDVSTEGSDENGSNHIDRNMGSYGNSNHPMHHTMQMYSQMGWPNSASKMLQN